MTNPDDEVREARTAIWCPEYSGMDILAIVNDLRTNNDNNG